MKIDGEVVVEEAFGSTKSTRRVEKLAGRMKEEEKKEESQSEERGGGDNRQYLNTWTTRDFGGGLRLAKREDFAFCNAAVIG